MLGGLEEENEEKRGGGERLGGAREWKKGHVSSACVCLRRLLPLST